MTLRSTPVLKVRDALSTAAADGYGLRLSELKQLIPRSRDIFSVIWELRCWGAETISVKKGRQILGWVLKTDIAPDPIKSSEPTAQTSIPYRKAIFRPIALKPRKKRKAIFRPAVQQPQPLTKAATKLGLGA